MSDSKYTTTSLGVQGRTGPGFGVKTAKARGRSVVAASAQESESGGAPQMSRDKRQSSVLGCEDSKYTTTLLGVQRRIDPGFGVKMAKARGRCERLNTCSGGDDWGRGANDGASDDWEGAVDRSRSVTPEPGLAFR